MPMNYIGAEQAAAKWNISPRRVQALCRAGAIEGVQRVGRVWAIPENAPKPSAEPHPAAPRADVTAEAAPDLSVAASRVAMPLVNTAFAPGQARAAAEAVEDEHSRNLALAEYYFFSGQAARASELSEPYLASEDWALRLSACWIYGYANLTLDRILQARQALFQVQKTLEDVDENTPVQDKALAVCIATASATLLHLPLPEGIPPAMRFARILSPGLRLFILYVQAHYVYLQQHYEASIGIVETALTLEGETYPIPSIYLHLVATMDYMALKQPAKAREHLLEAWALARPDDLIEAFGEHHGLLGGMLEQIIKKEWPEDFRRIIAITYSFSAGWRKIHNPLTGHQVADDLTTTEFTVAMLAARGWSNKEIGAHLGVSANTVKLHISAALQKLGISQRRELAQFMLK